MAESIWQDVTSYSRGERGKVEPRAWAIQLGPVRVMVHRWLGLSAWFLSTVPVICEREQLEGVDPEDAKVEALRVVRTWLASALDALPKERA